MYLSQLYVYPIKSLAGIAVQEAELSPFGLMHDRRWMLVQPDGQFITARRVPQMVLLQPEFRGEDLIVSHRQRDVMPLEIPSEPETDETLRVNIWNDHVDAHVVSPFADAWFSEQLGIECRLVYLPDDARRQVDPERVSDDQWVSFADGYPYLLISEASLRDLNQRLPQPVDMRRFRPNFVVAEAESYAEDNWQTFTVGAIPFVAVKPCARCVLTTVNPDTAQTGKEPLATLATYRTQQHKVMFGMNVIGADTGTIRVGDQIVLGA